MMKKNMTLRQKQTQNEITFVKAPIIPARKGGRTAEWNKVVLRLYASTGLAVDMTIGQVEKFSQSVIVHGGKITRRGHFSDPNIPKGKLRCWLIKDCTKPGWTRPA